MTPDTIAWIERQKPALVGWAETYVRESKLYLANENDPEPDDAVLDDPGRRRRRRQRALVSASQLRNLLNAAQHGTSLKALVNFLRYQIGRGTGGWGHGRSARKLEKLILGELRQLCDAGAEEHAKGDGEIYQLEANLAAQLLGFIVREYTYRCELAGTRS